MKKFPLVELPKGSAVPQHLQEALKAELAALSELGYPHVGFLLRHEYTRSGLVPEVRGFPSKSYGRTALKVWKLENKCDCLKAVQSCVYSLGELLESGSPLRIKEEASHM